MIRVLVIHRDVGEATDRAGRLRAQGFDARPYLTLGPKAFREIRADPPDVVLLDLIRTPSYGKTMGALIRESRSLCALPLVFVEGAPERTREVRALLPGARFARWADVAPAIEKAAKAPSKNTAVRPPARTAAQKMGIREGSAVAWLHAPDGLALELPDGASLVKIAANADVVLAFYRSEAALDRDLPALAKLLEDKRKLWVLWPKQAVANGGLKMPRIREMAIGYGLIDYKVCAVDATWSGMALSKRRPR